mgnify:CR=1 FL=1
MDYDCPSEYMEMYACNQNGCINMSLDESLFGFVNFHSKHIHGLDLPFVDILLSLWCKYLYMRQSCEVLFKFYQQIALVISCNI